MPKATNEFELLAQRSSGLCGHVGGVSRQNGYGDTNFIFPPCFWSEIEWDPRLLWVGGASGSEFPVGLWPEVWVVRSGG